MNRGYLIAEEGPLAGMTIVFEEEKEGNEWSLGRDPESSDIVLEEPMASRQHATIRLTPEGFLLENLSTVNPATQNGMVIAEPVLLKEGDIIQIGSTFFRFSEKEPSEEGEIPSSSEEPPREKASTPDKEIQAKMASELHFGPDPETRWLLKVISGPNSGAELALHKSSTYLTGKDPNICDIVFQDLSVSRQHARLTIDADDNVFIEDLGSRNGIIVNGELISEKQALYSQDLVALGTTTFLVIDRHEARETIISPIAEMPKLPSKKEALKTAKMKKDWKELIIPKRHLALAAVLGSILIVSMFAMLSLFKAEPISIVQFDKQGEIEEALAKFPAIQFSFNAPSGKLFLTGHVSTTVDHQEMLHLLQEIPFIEELDDNVIVDELVWQNMNALLSRNPKWIGVNVYSPKAGEFVLRGYVATLEEGEKLTDYVNRNFDYLDRLANEVVIEQNLQIQLQALLIQRGLSSVSFELSNGEVVFTGRIDEKEEEHFAILLHNFKRLPGIRSVKNFVIITKGDTSRIDLSDEYQITGYSQRGEQDFFVVINGRILGQGDAIDGMLITGVKRKMILLEREGIKYRIDYNR